MWLVMQLHALICASPLLLQCFFVLNASLHSCTVVFSQKDNTKIAMTIIFMTRLVTPESPEVLLSQQWGILLIPCVPRVPNVLYKAADKVWWSSLFAERRNYLTLLWFILQPSTLQTMPGCLSCAAVGWKYPHALLVHGHLILIFFCLVPK